MIPSIEVSDDSEMKQQTKNANANDEIDSIDLEHYRRLVRTHIDMRRYKTALFWSEKVAVLSEYDPKDIYWQAQCMFMLREYHRAAHLIKSRGLEKTNIFCNYLLVECLFEAKEYQQAIDLLHSIDLDYLTSSLINCSPMEEWTDDTALNMLSTVDLDRTGPTKSEILASICLLKGKILEAMDNRTMAMDCYVEALHLSVYCTEALDALVQHEMLLASEENDLITYLPTDGQCTENERKILIKLYKSKLKKYHETAVPQTTTASETPNANLNTIKSIIEFTEKTKTDRANAEFRRNGKDATSKFCTPIHQNNMSPSHKYLNDIKSSSFYSLQSSLTKHTTPTNTVNSEVTPPVVFKSQTADRKKRNASAANAIRTWIPVQIGCDRLDDSVDIVSEKAELLFYNNEFKKCIGILDEILKTDPYHCKALTVLVGCLMGLKEHNKLFCIAHKLVDLYSDQAISWYAVGCYYDLIGKSDPARRYLSKATSIDRLFGPAWLAYGHSFAKENEHDQAMAAYFKATQLMRGCHLPLLYIGVECGLTKNIDLAEKFFYQAMSIAPLDVNVLHELGVIKFEYEQYGDAEEILRTTLNMVMKMAEDNMEPISPRWEPLLNNLGHCCRKNKKYNEALHYHERALILKPQTAPTYTAIGFVYALKGDLSRAIDYLHGSLALKRDDIFTTALLTSCMEESSYDDEVSHGLDEEIASETNFFLAKSFIDATKKQSTSTAAMVGTDTKLRGMKITFDDESNESSDIDPYVDMSVD